MSKVIIVVGDFYGQWTNCHTFRRVIESKRFKQNKFAQRAELQRTQLNKYIRNEVVLLNIDVLARMCSVLDCGIDELLEYIED